MDFRLPALDIRTDTITATGVSSGGFMSALMMLTDPETFKGIGPVIGGTPL
jgi:poly(3-hydroxybutyrate) depolymerase